MKHLAFFALGLALLAAPLEQSFAQEAPSPTVSGSPTPIVAPPTTPIPLADVVTQADAAEANLQEMQPASDAAETTTLGKDLPAVTREINAQLAETTQLLQPGVLLETLRDLEGRWVKLGEQLALWTRSLTTRANLIDKQIALLPDLQSTWTKTREAAQTSDTPPEIRQRIDGVLAAIAQTENALQKRRAAILTEQSRVAEQSKRVTGALASIRAAQNAAVSRLFERDSAPVWSPQMRQDAAHDLVEGSQNSFGAQFLQLRAYVSQAGPQFAYLALLFGGLATALLWVKRRAAKWTDDDPLLERANRVLRLPVATATVLTLLVCRPLFEDAPRLFWALLAALTLPPIVIILRQLIDRLLFPILNALVVFYVIAQIRKVAASLPGLSRLILLLEMVGGAIFLLWFIRSTRLPALATGTASHKTTRAAARVGVFLFAAVFLANALGYFRLANYLAMGSLVSAYLSIFLYAAAGVVAGLIFFAMHMRPLSALGVVRRHRPLLQYRLTRIVFFIAFVVWVLTSLDAFSLRVPLFDRLTSWVTAEASFQTLHISLGAVLAFALTIWIASLLSRLIRFLLEEDIYDRFHFNRGSSYAISTLLHYVVLLLGFIIAIAALGADMTKFTVLAGAFGVGIGFGLQNIVNNFVSGLILLFEQPVKVGDVVQVQTDVGVIRRIGIRASIIRLFDSSELIVPNGQLVSEKVTNYTLSNRQRRIEIKVGVAYGSDPKRVIELLTAVAATHPLVTKTPAPQTLMLGFGSDSLDFDVRLWTDDYDQWLQIRSDVTVAITEALAAAKITIPFPQRDLHLQSIDPAVAAAFRKPSGSG
ncbi:MAG: mechanosensitive ion channel domain-containing protein [Chthoniobacterales bacterium]